MTHDGVVITRFAEFHGVYEFHKAQAFAKHLRTLANLADRSQSVRKCEKAPEREWVSLQEWTEGANGIRVGQWQSDIEVDPLL